MNATPNVNKKTKISVIHPECGVSWNGGSQISAFEISEHLVKYFDVELLCGKSVGTVSKALPCIPRGSSAKWLNESLIGKQFSKLFGYPGLVIEAVTSFFPFLFYLLKNPPDIVFPNNDYAGLSIAWVLRRLRGSKILYTERAGWLDDGKVLIRNMHFKPDHLVVFNEETAEKILKVYPEQSVSVITNGVDLGRFSPEGSKINTGLNEKIVLCVGTLNRNNHKRIELAIRAVAKLSNVSLILCGDGQDKEYFHTLGEELLGESRFLITSLTFDEMPDLYRSVDLFTLPSHNEPFGRVYLEALASGISVVAPNDDMRRTIVGDAGILCDVENLASYTLAIRQALDTDWHNKPTEQAANFSWSAIATQYKHVIEKMIEKS